MKDALTQHIQRSLEDRQACGLFRERRLAPYDMLLDFSCNDYLSFAQEPQLRRAYQEGFANHSIGSGGSLVLCGYHSSHHDLERAFAQMLHVDDCLLFTSGYVANLAVVSLLSHYGVHCLIDKAVHASIYDGLRFSQANYTRFHHNDMQDLQQKLNTINEPVVVLTESLFSMSGQQAPLAALNTILSQRSERYCIVDEAHGFGLLGPHGMGGVAAAGLNQEQVPLRIIPFGKALAGSGAVVAGQKIWVDALLQVTRQPIYSTSISPAMASGLLSALHMLQEADNRRQHLARLVIHFKNHIMCSESQWRNSDSPIQQLQLGCPLQASALSAKLAQHQIRCLAIRQPTVPKQDSGLRVVLNYSHTLKDIDRLFEVLKS